MTEMINELKFKSVIWSENKEKTRRVMFNLTASVEEVKTDSMSLTAVNEWNIYVTTNKQRGEGSRPGWIACEGQQTTKVFFHPIM